MEYIQQENGLTYEVEMKAKKMNDDIIERLVAYRKQLKMTQQDIADATGIKRANIARIESKRHAITLECLMKYAESLNMEVCFSLKKRA